MDNEVDLTEPARRLNEIASGHNGMHRAMVDAFCTYLFQSGRDPLEFEVVTQWVAGGLRTFIRPKQEEMTEQQKIGYYIGLDPGFHKEE